MAHVLKTCAPPKLIVHQTRNTAFRASAMLKHAQATLSAKKRTTATKITNAPPVAPFQKNALTGIPVMNRHVG